MELINVLIKIGDCAIQMGIWIFPGYQLWETRRTVLNRSHRLITKLGSANTWRYSTTMALPTSQNTQRRKQQQYSSIRTRNRAKIQTANRNGHYCPVKIKRRGGEKGTITIEGEGEKSIFFQLLAERKITHRATPSKRRSCCFCHWPSWTEKPVI